MQASGMILAMKTYEEVCEEEVCEAIVKMIAAKHGYDEVNFDLEPCNRSYVYFRNRNFGWTHLYMNRNRLAVNSYSSKKYVEVLNALLDNCNSNTPYCCGHIVPNGKQYISSIAYAIPAGSTFESLKIQLDLEDAET